MQRRKKGGFGLPFHFHPTQQCCKTLSRYVPAHPELSRFYLLSYYAVNQDAGGRDGGCTSLWLVSWGPQSVHGIYPKGSRGGLSHEDLKTYMAQDGNGRKYQVTGDKYNWRCGLAVRDWRGVVRIANVPVAALGKRKGEEGFVDLQKLTIEAKNRMPQHLRRKAVWYANADVLTALELQNSDAGQVQLHYGEFFDARAVPVLHGRPVRQCDAIASDEASI